MKYCDFTVPLAEDPRFFKCPRCGAIGIANHYHPCGKVPDFDIRTFPEYSTGKFVQPVDYGPGTELMHTFSSWGLPPCKLCYSTAQKMNALGDEGCIEQIDELVEEIIGNSTKHPALSEALSAQTAGLKLAAKAPNVVKRAALRRLIKQAVKRSRETWAQIEARADK